MESTMEDDDGKGADESADPLRPETPQEPPLPITTGACERSDRLATEYTSNNDLQRDSELRQMGLNLSTLRPRLRLVNWPEKTLRLMNCAI